MLTLIKHLEKAEKANEVFLYAICDIAGEYVKVGKAKSINKRLAQLQTANPSRLIVVGLRKVYVSEALVYEATIHRRLKQYHVLGEWFRYTDAVYQILGEGLLMSATVEPANRLSSTIQ